MGTKNRVRVLVLSHMYPRKQVDPTNGVFVHEQVKVLVSLGCEVRVVSPTPLTPRFVATNEKRRKYYLTPIFDSIDGIYVYYPRYVRLPGAFFHPISSLTMYAGLREIMDKLISEFAPHIIHAHTITPDGYVSCILSKKYGIPFIITVHGSDANVYPFRDKWTMYQTKFAINRADRIICVSYALKNKVCSFSDVISSVRVVHNGSDIKRFVFNPETRDTIQADLGLTPQDVVLVFIGNLLREKGLKEMMEAFSIISSRVRNLHCVIVGDGPFWSALVEIFKANDIGEKVHFVGRKPHHEVPNWLSAGDIFVLPSWREGHPTVVVEAMACSLPVIATSVGGIPETIESSKNGILVKKGSVEELADAINWLVADPDIRRYIGINARKTIEQCYTWEQNAKSTIAIYKEVLEGEN